MCQAALTAEPRDDSSEPCADAEALHRVRGDAGVSGYDGLFNTFLAEFVTFVNSISPFVFL